MYSLLNPRRKRRRRNPKLPGKELGVAAAVGLGIYVLAHTLEDTGSEETDALLRFIRERPMTSAMVAGIGALLYQVG